MPTLFLCWFEKYLVNNIANVSGRICNLITNSKSIYRSSYNLICLEGILLHCGMPSLFVIPYMFFRYLVKIHGKSSVASDTWWSGLQYWATDYQIWNIYEELATPYVTGNITLLFEWQEIVIVRDMRRCAFCFPLCKKPHVMLLCKVSYGVCNSLCALSCLVNFMIFIKCNLLIRLLSPSFSCIKYCLYYCFRLIEWVQVIWSDSEFCSQILGATQVLETAGNWSKDAC